LAILQSSELRRALCKSELLDESISDLSKKMSEPQAKGYIQNQDIRATLDVSRRQATRIAQQLVALGWLEPKGERRGRHYMLAQKKRG